MPPRQDHSELANAVEAERDRGIGPGIGPGNKEGTTPAQQDTPGGIRPEKRSDFDNTFGEKRNF